MPVATAVFVVMGAAWWYDRRSLVAEMREIKLIAQGLFDEIKHMREKYDDTSAIAGNSVVRIALAGSKAGAPCR